MFGILVGLFVVSLTEGKAFLTEEEQFLKRGYNYNKYVYWVEYRNEITNYLSFFTWFAKQMWQYNERVFVIF